jgi:hypothetical protein
MDRSERAIEVMEKAKKLGVCIEFNFGLTAAKLKTTGDPERQRDIIAELVKYLPEVRSILMRRAVATRAKELLGRRIWSREHGEGTLTGASNDGVLTVKISAESRMSHEEEVRRSQMSITANAEGLLIVEDEEADCAASSPGERPGPEKPRRGIFELLRGTSSDSKNMSGRER